MLISLRATLALQTLVTAIGFYSVVSFSVVSFNPAQASPLPEQKENQLPNKRVSEQQTPASEAASAQCAPLLKYRFNRLQDEAPQALCQYAGKAILVVNTASYCGFTRQYKGLEALYAAYGNKGLVVLGFPSNDFGKQEPGNSKEIADLCYNTYGVKFPMFSKTVVTGPRANGLYQSLTSITGQAPKWNFHKYLIDRKGSVVKSYASEVEPDNKILIADIEKVLAQKP
jgi:glutathione peroxidase